MYACWDVAVRPTGAYIRHIHLVRREATLLGNIFLFLSSPWPSLRTIKWLADQVPTNRSFVPVVSVRMQLLHDRVTRHSSTTATSKKFMPHASLPCVTRERQERIGGTTEPEGREKRKNKRLESKRTELNWASNIVDCRLQYAGYRTLFSVLVFSLCFNSLHRGGCIFGYLFSFPPFGRKIRNFYGNWLLKTPGINHLSFYWSGLGMSRCIAVRGVI
jgi:hypothetical protein